MSKFRAAFLHPFMASMKGVLRSAGIACLAFSLPMTGMALAHDGVDHSATPKEPQAETQAVAAPALPDLPFPFTVDIGDGFDLVDQFGNPRTLKDGDGRYQLVFFGYANCDAICSAAIPLMVAAIDALGDKVGRDVTPIMVTVDPARDTPEGMREALPKYDERIVGLTGSDDELARVRKIFHVEVEHVADDWDGSPIYSHGSFVYLLSPTGEMLTLIPPVTSPENMAKIIGNYM